jgi:hypothetical protein
VGSSDDDDMYVCIGKKERKKECEKEREKECEKEHEGLTVLLLQGGWEGFKIYFLRLPV